MKKTPCHIFVLYLFVCTIAVCVGCQTLPAEKNRPEIIAVWDFESYGHPAEFPGLDIGELLSTKVIEVLNESGKWMIVERERLLLALEELNIGSGPIAADTARLEVGRLLGVRRMVFGSVMTLGETMQLNLRMVDVETGWIIKSAEQTAEKRDIGAWLEVAAAAAGELQ